MLITTWKNGPPDRDGTADNDSVMGDNRVNHLRGLEGNDYVYGGNGQDVLEGNDGNDLIVGAAGADLMTGGAGSDTFMFVNLYDWTDAKGATFGETMDAIADFSPDDFMDFTRVSSGAVNSFSQFSFVVVGSDMRMDVDLGGLDTNDMHIMLLGVSVVPDESQFILA